MLLVRHLAGRRGDDDAFIEGLAEACEALGAAFEGGQLTIRSQGHNVMAALAMAAADLPDADEGD